MSSWRDTQFYCPQRGFFVVPVGVAERLAEPVEKLADLDHSDSQWASNNIALSQVIEEAKDTLSDAARIGGQ